ncbi:MAG: hypothetical protein ABIR30_08445 [Chitinophagaceae bacterium]
MKSILYVSATLMIVASIYGFVDYKQTSQKKEFNNMYAEEKLTEPDVIPVVEKKTTPSVVNNAVAKKTTAVSKKAVALKEETLPSIKPIPEEEKITATETKKIGNTSVDVTPAKENNVAKKVKKRKLNTKLFSRGALDERYIEPKVKTEPTKEEAKKTENKEQ